MLTFPQLSKKQLTYRKSTKNITLPKNILIHSVFENTPIKISESILYDE